MILDKDGNTLKSVYSSLWKALHDYDLSVSVNNLLVEYEYNKLMGFKFEDIVPLFTDYTRKLVANALHLKYLPYTEKQLESLKRVMRVYPDNIKTTDKINTVIQNVNRIYDDLIEQDYGIVYLPNESAVRALSGWVDEIYQIDERYVWMVVKPVMKLIDKLGTLLKDTTPLQALRTYLEHADTPQLTEDFTSLIVEDVSTLLIYNYPHPEMVLAIEKIKRLLPLLYKEGNYRKLFAMDVDATIERYLAYAKPLVQSYMGKQTEQINSEQLTLDIKTTFDKLKSAYANYYRFGKDKRQFYELYQQFSQLPFITIEEYPEFFDMVKFVNRLEML